MMSFPRCSSTVHMLLSLILLLPGKPSGAEELKIAAIVNNDVITQEELDRAMAPVYLQLQASHSPEEIAAKAQETKKWVLQELIEQKLMLQEAHTPRPVEVGKGKVGTPPPITVSDTDVDEMMASTSAQFANPEEFTRALAQQGLTLEDLKFRYRDQITVQKLISREIRSRVSISPAEVTAYFESHPQEFTTPPAVQTAVLLIRPTDTWDVTRAESTANDLRRRIAQGEDFYELALKYSDGPNAKMGGRIGFLEKGKSLKEIDAVLFGLRAGELSPVIRTASGFYLFRVESVRPSRQATIQEVQSKIQDRLFQEKLSARYKEWMEKLKANSYIAIP